MVGREDLRAIPDAWRAYLDVALGLTETSRQQATRAVRRLVGKGGATADQLQTMAEDVIKTGLANREALGRLVRFELERTLGRLGLATADEVTELTARVRDLERELRVARSTDGGATGVAAGGLASDDLTSGGSGDLTAGDLTVDGGALGGLASDASSPAAKKATAKKAAAKKVAGKKAVAKKAAAKKPPVAKSVAKKAAKPPVPSQPPRDGEDRA